MEGHVALAISKNKLIHAYGPLKKTLIMPINQTIKRIKKTANLEVVGVKRIELIYTMNIAIHKMK